MKLLVLTHNFEMAKSWLENQNIPNLFILEEHSVAETNPHKFKLGFLDLDYSKNMVSAMKIMSMSYKAKRPVAFIMDMRHQTAVDQIPHDHSILVYDNSLKLRLSYHPLYSTDFGINNVSDIVDFSVDIPHE